MPVCSLSGWGTAVHWLRQTKIHCFYCSVSAPDIGGAKGQLCLFCKTQFKAKYFTLFAYINPKVWCNNSQLRTWTKQAGIRLHAPHPSPSLYERTLTFSLMRWILMWTWCLKTHTRNLPYRLCVNRLSSIIKHSIWVDWSTPNGLSNHHC